MDISLSGHCFFLDVIFAGNYLSFGFEDVWGWRFDFTDTHSYYSAKRRMVSSIRAIGDICVLPTMYCGRATTT